VFSSGGSISHSCGCVSSEPCSVGDAIRDIKPLSKASIGEPGLAEGAMSEIEWRPSLSRLAMSSRTSVMPLILAVVSSTLSVIFPDSVGKCSLI